MEYKFHIEAHLFISNILVCLEDWQEMHVSDQAIKIIRQIANAHHEKAIHLDAERISKIKKED